MVLLTRLSETRCTVGLSTRSLSIANCHCMSRTPRQRHQTANWVPCKRGHTHEPNPQSRAHTNRNLCPCRIPCGFFSDGVQTPQDREEEEGEEGNDPPTADRRRWRKSRTHNQRTPGTAGKGTDHCPVYYTPAALHRPMACRCSRLSASCCRLVGRNGRSKPSRGSGKTLRCPLQCIWFTVITCADRHETLMFWRPHHVLVPACTCV